MRDLDEGLALVDAEVERVRKAWAVIVAAPAEILGVLMAEDQAKIAGLEQRRLKLEGLAHALHVAAKEAANPTTAS